MHKLYQTINEEYTEPVLGDRHSLDVYADSTLASGDHCEHVTGYIPEWVNGNLYRNGPGMYEVGQDKYKHWLDPLAMLQCFRINNKQVTYQSKFLRSDAYNLAKEANRIVVHEFGTVATPDPCLNSFKRQLTHFEMDSSTDNTNVSFFSSRDELYTATERNIINRIDPDTLDRLEKIKLQDYVAVNSATAHPHVDPDGTVHNLGNTYHGWPKTCIVKIPPKKETGDSFPIGQVVSSVPSQSKMHVNYLHSFGMSENYYVFIEQPLHMNMAKIASTKIQCASLEWKPLNKPRFRILDKRSGAEINKQWKYEADTFMFMHHINTYEDKGHIVCDLIAYQSDSVLEYLYMKDLEGAQCEEQHRKITDPVARRYVIPLKVKPTDKVGQNLVTISNTKATAKKRGPNTVHLVHDDLAGTGIEFPQINYRRYNTKKYRYLYGVGWHAKEDIIHTKVTAGNFALQLLKIDVDNKTHLQWKQDHCFPSEPVFVPRPDGTSEDDGVLLSAINRTDYEDGRNAFLLVLDAKTMEELGRAEFGIPRFPKDLHGIFSSKTT